jgi:hypothetical protein
MEVRLEKNNNLYLLAKTKKIFNHASKKQREIIRKV